MSENQDFFRLSIDFSLLIIMCRAGLFASFEIAITAIYVFILIYNLYHYSFKKIYQVNPVLINDLRLIKNAAALLWAENKLKLLMISFFVLILFGGLAYLFHEFLLFANSLSINWIFLTGSMGIAGIFLVIIFGFFNPKIPNIYFYTIRHDTWYRFLIFLFRLTANLKYSYRLIKQKKNIDFSKIRKNHDYNFTLDKKPNIYLIFIESYGSLLLKDSIYKNEYLNDLGKFIENCKEYGWHTRSHLSQSSTLGPSWFSYTSVFLGMRVNNTSFYEFILNNEIFHKMRSLQKIFMDNGYNSYFINSTKHKTGISVPFENMAKLYGINQWVLRKHIPYNGPEWGFNESPPDQYVLNYAFNEYIKNQPYPFILFYLTINSHSPFISPELPVEYWRNLNDGNYQLKGNNLLQHPYSQDYLKAIKYQLLFLKDFIQKNGTENDIFFLIGDHQPPVLTDEAKHGLETMVHVISKDPQFLSGFENYGFREYPSLEHPYIKHEALYSIILREIIRNFGKNNSKLPEFEPNGLQF